MKNEIKCPHCERAFKIDEAGYADIVKQIRDREFHAQIDAQMKVAEQQKEDAVSIARVSAERDKETALAEKTKLIGELQAQVEKNQVAEQLAIKTAVSAIEKERDELKLNLERERLDKEQKLTNQKEVYQTQISDRDDQIERLRDLKAKLSTKMIGETLEQHCEMEFNKIRATAFPRAFFEKDNDASSGSKGDYIFRDIEESGVEVVSIMFEMKNESDTTSTKKRNEDFLKELDKDRNEKGCEYAVLVSLLEKDSELYNTGIVDVSYKYPKMFVVRPQFFIQIIALLRYSGLSALKYKTELAEAREQHLDITNLEKEVDDFKQDFAINAGRLSKKYDSAISEIEKSILHLQKTKNALEGANKEILIAGKKADKLSVKRLTRNSPSIRAQLEAIRDSGDG
ncbi:DUF2130 domain-containing protein [Gammaproteobacteria bacterium]|nr:DUF2130 domain-containing protein [Gammaproteobacteria bacterium]